MDINTGTNMKPPHWLEYHSILDEEEGWNREVYEGVGCNAL